MTGSSPLHGSPLVLGEVLFDVFPDGSAVLGGAPFNVAWHLQGLGMAPVLVSRVGRDENGARVRTAMQAWGMDTSGLQEDEQYPTGQVRVALKGKDARFDILADQAYDHIDAAAVDELLGARDVSLLYHGSLIARSAANGRILEHLSKEGSLPAFVDINLRPPWWNTTTVGGMAGHARWLKLNDDELAALVPGTVQDSLEQVANGFREHHDLELLIVTLGARGAFLFSNQGTMHSAPPNPGEVVDTVGAGDAFSAVTIYGLHHGWPHSLILPRALAFASAICEQRGATSTNRALYADHLAQWESS